MFRGKSFIFQNSRNSESHAQDGKRKGTKRKGGGEIKGEELVNVIQENKNIRNRQGMEGGSGEKVHDNAKRMIKRKNKTENNVNEKDWRLTQ
jgi:hypothetical protein